MFDGGEGGSKADRSKIAALGALGRQIESIQEVMRTARAPCVDRSQLEASCAHNGMSSCCKCSEWKRVSERVRKTCIIVVSLRVDGEDMLSAERAATAARRRVGNACGFRSVCKVQCRHIDEESGTGGRWGWRVAQDMVATFTTFEEVRSGCCTEETEQVHYDATTGCFGRITRFG